MRVLGVTTNGSLGFVTSENTTYLPANSSYLFLDSNNLSDQYSALNHIAFESYKSIISEAPTIKSDSGTTFAVYTTDGILITDECQSISNLERGTYIIDGQKIYVE